MSDIEASKKEIDETLDRIMESIDEQIDEYLPQTIRLFAKLIFNLRYDLDDLKIHLKKVFKGGSPGEPEPEDLKYPPKEIKTNPERFYDDFYV